MEARRKKITPEPQMVWREEVNIRRLHRFRFEAYLRRQAGERDAASEYALVRFLLFACRAAAIRQLDRARIAF
jgi:hypothetical protein